MLLMDALKHSPCRGRTPQPIPTPKPYTETRHKSSAGAPPVGVEEVEGMSDGVVGSPRCFWRMICSMSLPRQVAPAHSLNSASTALHCRLPGSSRGSPCRRSANNQIMKLQGSVLVAPGGARALVELRQHLLALPAAGLQQGLALQEGLPTIKS